MVNGRVKTLNSAKYTGTMERNLSYCKRRREDLSRVNIRLILNIHMLALMNRHIVTLRASVTQLRLKRMTPRDIGLSISW